MKTPLTVQKKKGNLLCRVLCIILALLAVFMSGCHGKKKNEKGEKEENEVSKVATVSNLKINLLSSPFGVDKNDLRFSWMMSDPDENEVQSAYRVLISQSVQALSEDGCIFDSGWIDSNQSTDVRFPELKSKLQDNALYYWSVSIRDKDSKTATSQPQAFTTAVGGNWASEKGIWAGSGKSLSSEVSDSSKWSDYNVDLDLTVDEVALGIVFRAIDASNFYMWQFKVSGNTVTLYPHVFKNGAYVGSSYIASVKIDEQLSFSLGENAKVRISCSGNTVTTYLALDNGEYVKVDERDMSEYGFTKGSIGLRTGRTESGRVDNLKVTDIKSSKVLFDSDFSEDERLFPSCSVSNGMLNIPKGLSNGDIYSSSGECKDSFVFLRTELDITKEQMKKLDRAVLSVTAASPEKTRQFVYNMYVNNKLVGLGPSRYGKNADGKLLIYYNTYDVTSLINQGANCLAAVNYADEGRKFLSQLTLHYTDGSCETVSNSARDAEKWSSLPADKIFGKDNSIGTGHFAAYANNIDSTLYPYGFAKVGFDASDWNAVQLTSDIDDRMQLTPSQTDNMTRYESTGNITVKKQGTSYIADLGKEIIGGVRISFDLPREATVKVYYGEQLNANGTVKYSMLTGNKYAETWKLKAGKQTVETVDMLAYRYIQIDSCPVEIKADSICGLEIRTAFDEEKSSFTSDSKLLNDIYALMKHTVKVTTQDLYVDSQSRERLDYEGDLIINMMAAYAFSDDYSIPRFSNEYLSTHRTWPAEYLLFTSISALADYMATGDKASIEEYYKVLEKRVFTQYLDEKYSLLTTGNSGSSGNNAILTDWPTSERDGYDTGVKFNTVLNAVAVGSYEALAQIAELTGHTADAKEFAKLAEQIKTAMIQRLYNSETGAFSDGLNASGKASNHYAQHASAYALAFGIYTDHEMAGKIASFIEKQGEIKMSVYGSYFLFKGLYESGNGSVANKLLLNPDTSEGSRTYAYMLYEMNATITAEAWNSTNKGNMTLSHPWGAAPAYAIMSGIFGINPTKAGYETFDVRFCTEGLTNAALTVPTVKGSITASFEKGDKAFNASVSVPANTTANVYVPAAEGAKLTLNGKTVKANYQNGYAVVTVGSGIWNFEIK